MNKKNKFNWSNLGLKSMGITLLIATATSCTKNFKDYNRNPNLVDASLLKNDNVGVGSYFSTEEANVIINGIQGQYWMYQIATNLNADLYAGYISTATQGFQAQNGTYNFNSGWDDFAYTASYSGVMSPWLKIKSLTQTQYPHLFAIANIIKVEAMHRQTDIFGPIPYSQVGQNSFTVGFDSQQSIYNSFFGTLDSSIAALSAYVNQYPGAKPAAKFDMVFGGDMVEWIKFANSLKLRLAMRIRYADPAMAKKEAESAVNNSFGVMTSNSDNAALNPPGPLNQTGISVVNPLWGIATQYQDCTAGAVLGSFLNGYKDPRLPAYFTPSTSYPGTYIGVRTGITVKANKDRIGYSSLNIAETAPIQWMNAAEVYFLRSEGVLLGWNMGSGTAQSFYEQGIRTSFAQYGVSGADAYIADATSTPAPYIDPVEPTGVNDVLTPNQGLSTITIKWNDADPFEKKLERVITQKWISLYPNSQEAWSEFRRTGYPKIWPVVVNNSNGAVPTNLQVRRLPYPTQEIQKDPSDFQQAISELGGPDNGGTKLWWDKNPNH